MSIFNQRRYYFWVSLLLQSKLLSVALQNKAARPIGTESPLLYSTCGCLVNEPVTVKLERKKKLTQPISCSAGCCLYKTRNETS